MVNWKCKTDLCQQKISKMYRIISIKIKLKDLKYFVPYEI